MFMKMNSASLSHVFAASTAIKKQSSPAIIKKLETRAFSNSRALIHALQPAVPTYLMRHALVERAATEFAQQFNGTTLYAVKVNPSRKVLMGLAKAGVSHFDVASLDEIQLVRRFAPKATLFFMHPVKAREAIAEAYHSYGVRVFAVDCTGELAKIQQQTHNAKDVSYFVRLSLPHKSSAAIDLSQKFGADFDEAVALLQAARPHAAKLGVTFHVGSQCMDPASYTQAISYAASVIKASGVPVEMIDIGGGFAVAYPDMNPPSLGVYMAAIDAAFHDNDLLHLERFAEPGRALVATAGSLVVRVELRKGNLLYLNDGTYGGLFDAGKNIAFRFPCNAIRVTGDLSEQLLPFRFAGPTCDSLDMMDGPFYLPKDIDEGDYIEIGQMGAYSECLRTGFNGYKDYLSFDIAE
jgi:ornithine decarboxylase